MKKLQEILDLVKETGDRLIVMDQEGDPFILMNLANYRSLLREESKVTHLTEEELLEKINHLVAAWKSGQPDLTDYDLAQFRVKSIRQPEAIDRGRVAMSAPTYEPVVEPFEPTPAEAKKARQEELLAQVIDRSQSESTTQSVKERSDLDILEDEQYYPEPQEESI